MTSQRICDQQRQPCPSPWKCSTDCDFNVSSDTGHKVAHGKRIDYFGDAAKDLAIEVYDAPANFWDKAGFFGRLCIVVGAVLACCFTAGVLVGFAR